MYSLLYFIPKNYISYLVGKLVHLRLPGLLRERSLRWFAARYGINVHEAEKKLNEYSSIGDFFVRNLRPGTRPIGQGVLSPVDGTITQLGKTSGDRLLQIKGREYTLGSLLKDEELSRQFENGMFVTLYLAPHNYHHIHSPVDGFIKDTYYIRGSLWPVNSWSINNIDELFARNERVISVIDSARGKVAVVMVGAFNVGSIRTAYDEVQSNTRPRCFTKTKLVSHRRYKEQKPIARGERLATFYMGSSVVVLFQPGSFVPGRRCIIGPIEYGESISALSE